MKLNKDTVLYLLHERERLCPNDISYLFPEFNQRYTWHAIWKAVMLLARGFHRLGIRKGDAIAFFVTGRMELITSMYAAACLGAIIVPINTYSKKDELSVFLQESRPKVLIFGEEAHGQHYPTMISGLLEDCRASKEMDCSWLPSYFFVLNNEATEINPLFRSFSELHELAEDVDEPSFLQCCQSVSADDPLILLFTSGTLGKPKGVLRTAASFHSRASQTLDKKRSLMTTLLSKASNRAMQSFKIMNLLPLYHMGGFGTIITNLKATNIPTVMLSHFNPIHAMSVLADERCQVLVGTPFMIQRIIATSERSQYDLSSLIGVVFTSAAVNNTIVQHVTKSLKLRFFLVSYGSSEAGTISTGTCIMGHKLNFVLPLFYKLLKHTNLLGGIIPYEQFAASGYSLTGVVEKSVEVKILDPHTEKILPLGQQGEIVIRSHRVMRYIDENMTNDRFTRDGWYKSGDLGWLDEHRHLTVTGRLHRLISRGGEKISPIEIENVILQHKDVQEAFVLGVPDELYGEQICACIVAKQGSHLTEEILKQELLPYLSAFKLPREILFLQQMPMSATGKVSVEAMKRLILDRTKEPRKHA